MTKAQATELKVQIIQYGEAKAMGDELNAGRAREAILAMLEELTEAEPAT